MLLLVFVRPTVLIVRLYSKWYVYTFWLNVYNSGDASLAGRFQPGYRPNVGDVDNLPLPPTRKGGLSQRMSRHIPKVWQVLHACLIRREGVALCEMETEMMIECESILGDEKLKPPVWVKFDCLWNYDVAVAALSAPTWGERIQLINDVYSEVVSYVPYFKVYVEQLGAEAVLFQRGIGILQSQRFHDIRALIVAYCYKGCNPFLEGLQEAKSKIEYSKLYSRFSVTDKHVQSVARSRDMDPNTFAKLGTAWFSGDYAAVSGIVDALSIGPKRNRLREGDVLRLNRKRSSQAASSLAAMSDGMTWEYVSA